MNSRKSIWQLNLLGTSQKKGWKASLLRMTIPVGICYLLWCVFLFLSQDWIIFPRSGMEKQAQRWVTPPGVESIWLNKPNGEKVEGWYYQVSEEKRPLVIYFHGNAEIIDFAAQELKFYTEEKKFHLFLPEYRGYGRSTGSPGQKNIHEDMKAFLKILMEKPEIDFDNVIYHGRSIGSGVACDLVSYQKPKLLILESTFYSLTRRVRPLFVPSFLLRHPFRNNEVVSQLDIPIFITHGKEDSIFSIQDAMDLDRVAKNSRFVPMDAGHNNLNMDWEKVDKFLAAGGIR